MQLSIYTYKFNYFEIKINLRDVLICSFYISTQMSFIVGLLEHTWPDYLNYNFISTNPYLASISHVDVHMLDSNLCSSEIGEFNDGDDFI